MDCYVLFRQADPATDRGITERRQSDEDAERKAQDDIQPIGRAQNETRDEAGITDRAGMQKGARQHEDIPWSI